MDRAKALIKLSRAPYIFVGLFVVLSVIVWYAGDPISVGTFFSQTTQNAVIVALFWYIYRLSIDVSVIKDEMAKS